jgi:hypothetical protein
MYDIFLIVLKYACYDNKVFTFAFKMYIMHKIHAQSWDQKNRLYSQAWNIQHLEFVESSKDIN